MARWRWRHIVWLACTVPAVRMVNYRADIDFKLAGERVNWQTSRYPFLDAALDI